MSIINDREVIYYLAADAQTNDEYSEIETVQQHQQILPYCFNIIYAMKYDPHWQLYVERIKNFLRLHRGNKSGLNTIKKKAYIPLESVIHILEFCDAPTLLNVSSVCKIWFILANDEKCWEILCLKKFNITSKCFASGTNAKELYKLSYLKYQELFKNLCRNKIILPEPVSRAIFQIA